METDIKRKNRLIAIELELDKLNKERIKLYEEIIEEVCTKRSDN